MGKKAGLTKEAIIETAARLADRDGFDSLTLAGLAAELGVQSPSLYNHVDGLEGLRFDLGAHGAKLLGARFQESIAGKSELDALRAMASAFRAFAKEHPGLYAAAQPATSLDMDQRIYEAAPEAFDTVLKGVAQTGLSPENQLHIVRAVRASLHGFIVLEQREGFGTPDDVDESFERMLDILEGGLIGMLPDGPPDSWSERARRPFE
jgi:AcrR family transcriptional regulator